MTINSNRILQAVEAFNTERHQHYQNPLYPDPLNVAPSCINVVNSGEWPSTVPDKLEADGRFGIFPDESVGEAKEHFETMLQQAAKKDSWLKQLRRESSGAKVSSNRAKQFSMRPSLKPSPTAITRLWAKIRTWKASPMVLT